MKHSILVIYLAVVMLIVKQPWNFWLIGIGIAWAHRPPDWTSRFETGTALERLSASHQAPATWGRR